MNTRLAALLLVALAAIAAAGTGAYMAVRQTEQVPAVASTAVAPTDVPEATTAGGTAGVAETEESLTPSAGAEASTAGTSAALAPETLSPPVTVPAPERVTAPERPRRATPPARSSTPAVTSPATRPAERPAERATPSAAARDTTRPATRPETPAGSVAVPEPAERARVEPDPLPPPPPSPPVPQFEDVVIPADAVIGLQVETNVSTETARVEDRVDARVTRDVRAGGMVAIPAGTRAQGSVTLVEKGGKFKERARLGVRFHTLVMADGTRVPINTETIFREGDSPKGESAAKVGGAAVGGAIIGAILGGGKGAAIGGSVGAAGGTAAVVAGGRNPATLNSGTTVTARLSAPATVTVEK